LREYWHSGHVDHALVTDGGRRVLLAGVNNATKAATLVSLDPDTMTGASVEENVDYQLQGFRPSVELGRFLFARSDINHRWEAYALVENLREHDGEVTVVVNHRTAPPSAAVYYHLNHYLSLRDMVISSGFVANHAVLFPDHQVTGEETAGLRHIIDVTNTPQELRALRK
jgi:hypothetical protein